MPNFARPFAKNAIARAMASNTLDGRDDETPVNDGINPPNAPTNVVATKGNAQASVAFDAPLDDGGAAITSYTAVSTPGGISETGAGSPIVVTGLTNGVEYTFVVRATNSEGDSPNSAASNAVTPATVPGAPTIGAATSDGTSQTASVSFTAPADDGGSAITEYEVTSNPGGITEVGASSPIVINGLTDNTDYTFTVVARNAEGDSAASAASNSVRVESLGPELVPAGFTGWTNITGTGVSVDANGIHFVNASNIAAVGLESVAIVNLATYKVVHTVANVGSPNSAAACADVLLYGTSNNNVGNLPDHTPIGTGGTYTDYVTCNAAGTATTTAIRVRCNGTSGNNNFDVTALSVRQRLT